jgi:HEAT repeat protein
LRDESPNVRLAAAAGLVRRGRIEETLAVVEAGFVDPDQWVRHAALEVADRMGPGAAPLRRQVRPLTNDANEYVRRVAEHLRAELEQPAARSP